MNTDSIYVTERQRNVQKGSHRDGRAQEPMKAYIVE